MRRWLQPALRSSKNLMASSVVLMVIVVIRGAGALLPMALAGLRPDTTMRSHQRVRGETQRQRVSAVGNSLLTSRNIIKNYI
jgi:hypothetical protein